jgi:hypothetical protein
LTYPHQAGFYPLFLPARLYLQGVSDDVLLPISADNGTVIKTSISESDTKHERLARQITAFIGMPIFTS